MPQRIDREGTFLAKPIDWSMSVTQNSQSVALVVRYAILGQIEGDAFQDWTAAEVETVAYHYWVKKDGSLNTTTLDMLRKAELWHGNLAAVKNDFPPAVEVRLNIQNQPYNGKDQYKVAWVNHRDDDSQPGGITKMDDSGFRQLDGRFGSMLRALGGTTTKAAPPPPARAASKPGQFQAPPMASDDGVPPVGESDLPF